MLVERLREVSALRGFTRLNAPDDLNARGGVDRPAVARATRPGCRAARSAAKASSSASPRSECWSGSRPTATAERPPSCATRTADGARAAASRPRMAGPCERYVLLHSFAHALIRELALECGYTASSIRERIYAASGAGAEPMAGVLLYTAAPDSEGTLGGLVSLGEPEQFGPLLRQALERAQLCSSDPLCSEHDPRADNSVHAAACHACQFASETSCERGNRYLDRATIVRHPATRRRLVLRRRHERRRCGRRRPRAAERRAGRESRRARAAVVKTPLYSPRARRGRGVAGRARRDHRTAPRPGIRTPPHRRRHRARACASDCAHAATRTRRRSRPVWTGPGAAGDQRLTAAVLHELVAHARERILLVSYAAYTLAELADRPRGGRRAWMPGRRRLRDRGGQRRAYSGPQCHPFGAVAGLTAGAGPPTTATAAGRPPRQAARGRRTPRARRLGEPHSTSALTANLEAGVLIEDPDLAAELEAHVHR